MKKIILLFVITFFGVSCSSTSSVAHASKDGSSFDKAILINENSETKGVAAEYVWLRNQYPGSKINNQSLSENHGKSYDVFKIVTASDEEKTIYFDISKFFGKM